MEQAPVIYFDGVCNLCTGAVQFILKRDRKKLFRFASLQGRAGEKLLTHHGLPTTHFKTMILESGGKIFTGSTAALMITRKLGAAWPLLYVLIIIPRFIRDAVYNLVASKRYTWFGKKEECWVPDPEWKSRFLD